MATDKQITSARTNGAKSRGPITPEGKLACSRNSRKHGIFARTVLLEGESRAKFDDLVDSLVIELRPQTPVELMLVEKMATAQWRQMRLISMERAGIAHEIRLQKPDVDEENAITREYLALLTLRSRSFNEHEMRYDRQFHRAHERLIKMRNNRETNRIL